MSQVKVGIVEGWTGALDFELLNDNTPQNLTGLTITGQARNRLAQWSDLAGDVSVISSTAGQVRLNPDTADFAAAYSPYELRFKARDASTFDVFFPSEEAILLIVRP